MIQFKHKGDFGKTTKFFESIRNGRYISALDKYGQMGVDALAKVTPKRTGKTAASWSYEIEQKNNTITITWCNSNVQEGKNIALLIQLGHSTSSGYYIEGRDYINPALKPIFDALGKDAWEEVSANG